MKIRNLLISLTLVSSSTLYAQTEIPSEKQRNDITALIDQYSLAREKSDTVLLKKILTTDIDQLVSTGEWRTGVGQAVQGMLASSKNTSGKRKLTVHNIRFFNANTAIVDCQYEIMNDNGISRRMWSTFLVVSDVGSWKISAIRNMMPSGR